jgi:hypothetical protein
MTNLSLDYLHGYWQRALRMPGAPEGAVDLDRTLLCGLRVGLLETLRFLNERRPSYEQFEAWIAEQNGGAVDANDLARLRAALDGETVRPEANLDGVEGLSAEELAHWDEHGYVVVREAVSAAQAKAAEMAIYEYLAMDPDDPDSWYANPQGHSIWVSLLRHPAFWANRRSPRLVKAFAQLWGREDLWASVDQGGLNPPERAGWQFPGPHMHWDTTLAEPHYFGLQGILYLVDVAENQGAFTCIPGFHRTLKGWLAELPKSAGPRAEILKHPGAKPIAARAGDLVIWNNLLPHGSSPNRATRPRVAQYITLAPTRWEHNDAWK